jgi:hypothetical protein
MEGQLLLSTGAGVLDRQIAGRSWTWRRCRFHVGRESAVVHEVLACSWLLFVAKDADEVRVLRGRVSSICVVHHERRKP